MKKLLLLSLLLFASFSFGQATIPSTTLSAAIADLSGKQVHVASAAGILPNYLIFIDGEAMAVNQVQGNTLFVQRGASGTRASTHATSTQTWYGPQNYFNTAVPAGYPAGSCDPTKILALPFINTDTGVITNCTGGLWRSISSVQVSPNQNAFYLSTNCGTQTNCFTVKGNVQVVSDAVWTNGGTTITTGSGDPVFTSADVGKIEFGTSGCDPGNGSIDCILQVPQGTITAVTGAHTATVSIAATAASTSSGVAWFAWGTQDDATAMQSAMTAALAAQGGDIILPCNTMFVGSLPFYVSAPHNYPINIKACGNGYLIPLPNFSQSSCKASGNSTSLTGCIFSDWENGCLGSSCGGLPQPPFIYDHISDLSVWGLGQDGTGVSTRYAAISGGGLYIENVQIVGWEWKKTLAANNDCGFDVASSTLINDVSWTVSCGLAVETPNITDSPTVVYGGQYGISQNGPGMILLGSNPLVASDYVVTNGVTFAASLSDLVGVTPLQQGVVVDNAAVTWLSTSDDSGGESIIAGNAIIDGLDGDFLGRHGLYAASGTSVKIANSNNLGATTILSGATLYDQGGNNFGVTLSFAGTVIGSSTAPNMAIPAVPTYVGNNALVLGGGGAVSTNVTGAMPISTTAGNAIIVWVSTVNSSTPDITGCTDHNGDTFHIAAQSGGTSANQFGILYATNIAAGTGNTVTCTTTAAHAFFYVYAEEWAGIKTTSPVDVSGSINSAAATSLTTTLATTTPGDLIVSGMVTSANRGTVTNGAGFSSYNAVSGTSWNIYPIADLGAQSQVTIAAGSYAAAMSWTNSVAAQLQAVAFLSAGGTVNAPTIPNLAAKYNLPNTSAWKNGVFTGILYTSVGSAIASATTIVSTNQIAHVTGTTTISNITPPAPSFTGCIKLIPDGLWATTTGGNIALASTAVVSKTLTECYDGTMWYPSY